MKLSKIIAPELILNRRGDENARRLYKDIMDNIEICIIDGSPLTKVTKQEYAIFDEYTRTYFMLGKLFKERNGKTLYLPKDFGQALGRIDREIPIDMLPESFIGYIQFADGTFDDDSGPVDGAFIYIGDNHTIGHSVNPNDRKLRGKLCCITYTNKTNCPMAEIITKFCFPLSNNKLIDMVKEFSPIDRGIYGQSYNVGEGQSVKRLAVIRACVNAILYMNSADADILKLRPIEEFSHSKRKEYRTKTFGNENLCSVPITLLNWNYHEPKLYSVDSTFVHSHMRWQRVGPGLTQVKLVFVREHERKYSKESKNNVATSQRE